MEYGSGSLSIMDSKPTLNSKSLINMVRVITFYAETGIKIVQQVQYEVHPKYERAGDREDGRYLEAKLKTELD